MSWWFQIVNSCPVRADIGPYIALIIRDSGSTANSIYRGTDAERLLNKYHKSSQRQLYDGFIHRRPGFNPANPPGFSTHELRSDGVAYPRISRGNKLEWWMQGFDVNDSDVEKCIAQARKYGWELFRPYPGGFEHHHLNFKARPKRPRLGSTLAWRFFWLRAHLPRS